MNNKTEIVLALITIALVIIVLALYFGPLSNCRTTSPAGREFVVACKNVPDGWKGEELGK